MRLTVCAAVFNEEKNIKELLENVAPFADEIVIVDGGSQDKTPEIIKGFKNVKLINAHNPLHFHENKQKAIDAAEGKWVLQLDADERVSKELAREIREVIQQKDAKDGYYIPRKNWFLTRFLLKGGAYPDYTLRLYKKGKAHFVMEEIHENVVVKGEVGYLRHDLIHYSDPTFERYLARWNRYTTLEAQMLIKKDQQIGFFDYFFVKPVWWFLKTYIRHKGFMDGFAGFVFSYFSALRYRAIYIKWWQLKNQRG